MVFGSFFEWLVNWWLGSNGGYGEVFYGGVGGILLFFKGVMIDFYVYLDLYLDFVVVVWVCEER